MYLSDFIAGGHIRGQEMWGTLSSGAMTATTVSAGKLNSACCHTVRHISCRLPQVSGLLFVVENKDILIPVSVAAGEEQKFLDTFWTGTSLWWIWALSRSADCFLSIPSTTNIDRRIAFGSQRRLHVIIVSL